MTSLQKYLNDGPAWSSISTHGVRPNKGKYLEPRFVAEPAPPPRIARASREACSRCSIIKLGEKITVSLPDTSNYKDGWLPATVVDVMPEVIWYKWDVNPLMHPEVLARAEEGVTWRRKTGAASAAENAVAGIAMLRGSEPRFVTAPETAVYQDEVMHVEAEADSESEDDVEDEEDDVEDEDEGEEDVIAEEVNERIDAIPLLGGEAATNGDEKRIKAFDFKASDEGAGEESDEDESAVRQLVPTPTTTLPTAAEDQSPALATVTATSSAAVAPWKVEAEKGEPEAGDVQIEVCEVQLAASNAELEQGQTTVPQPVPTTPSFSHQGDHFCARVRQVCKDGVLKLLAKRDQTAAAASRCDAIKEDHASLRRSLQTEEAAFLRYIRQAEVSKDTVKRMREEEARCRSILDDASLAVKRCKHEERALMKELSPLLLAAKHHRELATQQFQHRGFLASHLKR